MCMKGLYDLFMIPLEKSGIRNSRIKLIKEAKGSVLEIGSGTGANLPYYNFDLIEKLVLSDKTISKRLNPTNDKTEVLEVNTEELPFDDNSFDYVIGTLVFCSVNNVDKGLSEILRVLKDEGTYIYIEHVLPQTRFLSRMFNFINPLWKRVAGGCNLNREFLDALTNSGFSLTNKNTFGKKIFVSGLAKKNNL